MANDTRLNPGATGDLIVTVDLVAFTGYPADAKLPASCLYVSASAGTAPTPVTNSNPIPVSVQGTVATTATIAGTVAASQSGAWSVAVSNFPATQPVSGTVTANAGSGTFAVSDGGGSLTVDDGGGSLTVDGSVSVSGNVDVTPASPAAGDYLPVRLTDGSAFYTASGGGGGNAAAGATGSAVPASADYAGLNVGGTLRGQTGLGLAGGAYAAQVDLASFGGAALVPGQASMSASIPVAIAANQSTLAVSGTVTANAGTGTFTVGGTVTANAGTGTMAVSAASLPLPAGAATAAKQPAPGTAGTASADVLSIQGIASMTAVKVDGSAVTQPVSIGAALPAGTNLLGAMAVGLRTDAIFNGTTALTPKWAVVNASSSGSNTIVPAVTSKKIRVLKWSLWAAGAVDATWRTSTGPADIHGKVPYSGTGSGPMGSGAFDPTGHFETLAGDGLLLNLSGAVAVTGIVQYVEV